jgi:hypothetical protein
MRGGRGRGASGRQRIGRLTGDDDDGGEVGCDQHPKNESSKYGSLIDQPS